MTTTVTGKLNQAASEFQAGESTGFGIRLGVQYYDREAKSKQWTNYECALFSKNSNQVDFLRGNLVEGAIVEVTGQQLKIKQFDGQNGLKLSLELIDAKLGYVHSGQAQAPQQPAQQAPQYQQPAPHAMGYQDVNGNPYAPQDVQRYQKAGVQPWPAGQQPPPMPAGY